MSPQLTTHLIALLGKRQIKLPIHNIIHFVTKGYYQNDGKMPSENHSKFLFELFLPLISQGKTQILIDYFGLNKYGLTNTLKIIVPKNEQIFVDFVANFREAEND